MVRAASTPSKMEVLLLTALHRAPMHGYELKLELQYKHVQWWAKCEHGHLYAALARLERGKFIKPVARPGGRTNQKVFAITASGRKRVVAALELLATQPDETYFDIDMFLSSCHLLEQRHVIELLAGRRSAIAVKRTEAVALDEMMRPHVPEVGRLIMRHRIDYLRHEDEFLDACVTALRAEKSWKSFLDGSRIEEFVERTRVPLER